MSAKRGKSPTNFLTCRERQAVDAAIAAAEKATSAEIKLIVLRHCWVDIKQKAEQLFKKHNLDKTRDRNAVLILLVTTNREFLIYGDKSIHEKVGQSFWDDATERMLSHFRQDEFAAGLVKGIDLIGEKLKVYFPSLGNDVNEISNEVINEKS